MNREAQRHFDVLVIGGGPAGMVAAARAAECGVRVGIVDDNFRLGGQIWRSASDHARTNDARSNVSQNNVSQYQNNEAQNTEASRSAGWVRASGATVLCGLRVVHQPE